MQPHVDQHCIVPDPGYNGTTNKRVYVCNDGGVYRTDDITTANDVDEGGWQRLDLTYQTTQYYGAAGHGTSGLIYGGTQDNATLRSPADNLNATYAYGGDGGFAAIDTADPNYCYGSHINLKLHRSTDGGFATQDIWLGIPDAVNGAANFVAPFILDPNNNNRMLAGGASLWRANNVKAVGQPTWTEIRPSGTSVISAIAVAPGNSDVIWVGYNDGRIYKTNNGLAANPTWTAVDNNSNPNPFLPRYPTRILIDKNDSNVAYVAFGGFANGNLQKTVSGGSGAWQDITGAGLPDVPIRGIARHPTFNKLYIGTEIGVYVSENDGATWSAALDGPSNVSVDEVVFMSNSTTLIAATHGRGIWTSDQSGSAPFVPRALSDFDGDGRSDETVYRPSNGTWYVNQSSSGFRAVAWGAATDKLVAADYDGDRKTDIAVFRPSTGAWYRINSTGGAFMTVPFGQTGDFPVPADYDGDGKADEAIFRPSIGTWYINQSTLGVTGIAFGESGDIPVPADYDCDGKADVALFRPSNGAWYLSRSTLGYTSIVFGQAGDKPVAADYDGDAKADVAVFRSGTWYLNQSLNGNLTVPWGESTDVPIPGGDYDGDGRADIAVFRPAEGRWYLRKSTNGFLAVQFGANGDAPFPALP